MKINIKIKNHRSQYHDQTINFMTSIEIDYATINQREKQQNYIEYKQLYRIVSRRVSKMVHIHT